MDLLPESRLESSPELRTDLRTDLRTEVLRSMGALESELVALLAYNRNLFQPPAGDLALPIADEPFVDAWRRYAGIAQAAGTLRALEPFLVQLRFPISAGISQDPAYIRSARQGDLAASSECWSGLALDTPEDCRVDIYPTPAGSIATITAGGRADFVRLVQAFGRKNEPEPLPSSMGALMISGYRNWHRVQQVRAGHDAATARAILTDPASSQDRFILLSRGPYSGVSAAEMGLDEQGWSEFSWLIRREHEVCHYFCRRVLGSMRNNIFDEMLADYCGIVQATGNFRADWLLRFLGLEHYPGYRAGARMENYRGTPPLGDREIAILQRLVYRAAAAMEVFHRDVCIGAEDWSLAVLALSSLHLEELAGPAALDLLTAAHVSLGSRIVSRTQTREVFT